MNIDFSPPNIHSLACKNARSWTSNYPMMGWHIIYHDKFIYWYKNSVAKISSTSQMFLPVMFLVEAMNIGGYCHHQPSLYPLMICEYNYIVVKTSNYFPSMAEQSFANATKYYISMASCKTAVTPLLMQWSYCSLALSFFPHCLRPCSTIDRKLSHFWNTPQVYPWTMQWWNDWMTEKSWKKMTEWLKKSKLTID